MYTHVRSLICHGRRWKVAEVLLMTLRTYVIRRLIVIIPTFFLISLIIFVLIHLAPGDPVRAMFAGRPVPPEIVDQVRRELGIDQPIYVQYLIWVGRLLQGDFGYSYIHYRPVLDLVGERIPRTLELMLVANFVSIVIAIALGVISAVKQYSLTDALCSLGALIGYSTPNFWIALVAIMFFSVQLGLLPISGIQSTVAGGFASPFHALYDHLIHLILPTSILVFGWTAYLFRMVRSSMLEVLMQDYIVTARAKGLRERVVIYKHALRNALLPVVTYTGFSIGFLLSGAAVIEFIFAWPGLGRFWVISASIRDYPTLMGMGMITALMVLLANLCADITYAIIDPRIRYE